MFSERLTVVWNEVKPGLYELWLCCEKQCDTVMFDEPAPLWTAEEAIRFHSELWALQDIVPLEAKRNSQKQTAIKFATDI